MLRLSLRTVWKSFRCNDSSSVSSTAIAVADRGSLSSSAISPKKSPGPRTDRMTSRPSSPRIVTLTRPSRIVKKKSPSSFSKKMITSDFSVSGSWRTTSSAAGNPSGGWPSRISRSISSIRSLLTPSKVTTRATAISPSLSIEATLCPQRRRAAQLDPHAGRSSPRSSTSGTRRSR